MRRVCVFAGSNFGREMAYRKAAEQLGRLLTDRGLGMVYGGARVGLMGTVADAVLGAGGEVIGVIPEALVAREVAHNGLSTLHVVASMHERKALMASLSDGFVALPGGWGTMDEFFEVLTWAQLGLHRKPCGLLNVQGYFDHLLSFVDHSIRQGFVRDACRPMVLVATSPADLLDQLARYEAPTVTEWIAQRPSGAFSVRPATHGDVPELNALIARSARELSVGYYSAQQIESAIRHVFGVDSTLVDDQTYYVVSERDVLVGCGGWSRRRTLYGGDQRPVGGDDALDPEADAARIRAFFVAPEHARRGIGRLILATCVQAAQDGGFSRLELMATLPGVPLYQAMGFESVGAVTDVLPDGTTIEFLQMTRPLESRER